MGLVHGVGVRRGVEWSGLFHVVDLLPTIVEGIAGGEPVVSAAPLDGINQWNAIISGEASARQEMLLELTPPAVKGQPWAKAIRVGDLKLIEGLPGCDPVHAFGSLGCPMGWLSLNPDGSTNTSENGYNVTEDNPSMVWLFDLRLDPQVSFDIMPLQRSCAVWTELCRPSLQPRRGTILHRGAVRTSRDYGLHC